MSKELLKSKRVESINVLRFVAAISVMMYHYTFMFFSRGVEYVNFPFLRNFFQYGYLGVDLFFIISGFVIAMTARGRNWKEFIVSRIARLYPALWICVSLSATVFLFANVYGLNENRVPVFTYLANLTLVPSLFHERMVDGSYWSLAVEIKFYFLIFLLILFRLYKHIEPITIGFSFALFIATFFLHISPNNASYFAAGILFYAVYEKGVNMLRATTLSLLCAISVFYASSHAEELSIGYHTLFDGKIISLYVFSFYVLFTVISLKLVSFKDRPLFMLMGAVTYPIYLLHQEIGRIFFKLSAVLLVPAYIALSIQIMMILGASFLIVRYFEKPLHGVLKSVLGYFFKKLPS